MYRKNTAGQHLCVQLLLTASGAVATGLTPAARRCIDGTFAAGGGTFTEDGTTGSYKYALAQADTNGNNISIIVTATGAIPVCVNFVTTAADPTDGVRLGLTALPNAAADAAGGLPISDAGGLDMDSIKTDTAAILVDTGTTLDGKIDTIDTNVDSILADTGTDGVIVASIAANAVSASALATDAVSEIADGILNRDMSTGTDSGSASVRTMRQALRFLRNKWSISGTTLTVTKEDDTTASWTSEVTGTAGADPITASDPAS